MEPETSREVYAYPFIYIIPIDKEKQKETVKMNIGSIFNFDQPRGFLPVMGLDKSITCTSSSFITDLFEETHKKFQQLSMNIGIVTCPPEEEKILKEKIPKDTKISRKQELSRKKVFEKKPRFDKKLPRKCVRYHQY